MIYVFFVIFGVIIGSFLNVLIYRLPREEEVVVTRSHCPKCNKLIPFYLNIPVISFLLLRGKCHQCHQRISLIYPLTEIVMGIVSLCLMPSYLSMLSLIMFLFYFSVAAIFWVHIIIDSKHQILPDSLTLFLGIQFLIYSIFFKSWMFWLIGGLVGFLFPFIVAWIFEKWKGQEGLGGGDIKLFGVLGIILGPFGILHNLFVSCFAGALVGGLLLLFKVLKRDQPMPFGPYILLVAAFQIYFPEHFANLIRFVWP